MPKRNSKRFNNSKHDAIPDSWRTDWSGYVLPKGSQIYVRRSEAEALTLGITSFEVPLLLMSFRGYQRTNTGAMAMFVVPHGDLQYEIEKHCRIYAIALPHTNTSFEDK